MRATPFEFRNRFWIFGAFYWIGFSLYSFDHVNVAQFVSDRITGVAASKHTELPLWGVATAAVFCFLCAAFRTWATAYLRADVMQDASLHAEKIVADGPYRHVRNPLYLGGVLLAFGMGLMMSRVGFLISFFGVAIFSLRLIGLEESNMRKERGESFAEYCRLVRRLLPSIRAKVPASGLRPHWGQAFLGELFMWGFFVAVAAFGITENQKVLFGVIALSLLVYVVRSYVVASRNKKKTAI
jgi:protein-S-isoprenylcysteine O-methyltransferase Ste14